MPWRCQVSPFTNLQYPPRRICHIYHFRAMGGFLALPICGPIGLPASTFYHFTQSPSPVLPFYHILAPSGPAVLPFITWRPWRFPPIRYRIAFLRPHASPSPHPTISVRLPVLTRVNSQRLGPRSVLPAPPQLPCHAKSPKSGMAGYAGDSNQQSRKNLSFWAGAARPASFGRFVFLTGASPPLQTSGIHMS